MCGAARPRTDVLCVSIFNHAGIAGSRYSGTTIWYRCAARVRSWALATSGYVTGFGCRPYTELDAGATGPAFESHQGRKTRGVVHPDQRALWGYRWHRRCSVGLVKPAALL